MDPTIGRWTQEDPTSHIGDLGQQDSYLYSGDDPVTLSDPSGLCDVLDCIGNAFSTAGNAIGSGFSTAYHYVTRHVAGFAAAGSALAIGAATTVGTLACGAAAEGSGQLELGFSCAKVAVYGYTMAGAAAGVAVADFRR